MTDTMIGIVRPFGIGTDIRPRPAVLLRAPTVPPGGDNVVSWGGAGNDIFQLRANIKQELPKPNWDETKRTYDVVRVMNPDDHDQFVDTEVMTEYQSRNAISKDRMVLRFGSTPTGDNIKIMSKGNIRTTNAS